MKTQNLKLQIRILGLVPVLAMAVAQVANAEHACAPVRTSLGKIEVMQTLVNSRAGQATESGTVDTTKRYSADRFERENSPAGIDTELAKKAAAISFQIFNPYKKDGGRIEKVTGFSGSGFLMGSQCHLFTALHVVDLSDGRISDLIGRTVDVVHGQSGKIFKAKVLVAGQGGRGGDWAFLKLDGKVDKKIQPASIAGKIPQSLVVSGYPVDMVSSKGLGEVTRPVISGPCKVSPSQTFGELNTNCRVSPGNSGSFVGGELDENGSPVAAGILTASDSKNLVAGSGNVVGNGSFLRFTKEIHDQIVKAGTEDDCD